MKIIDTTVAPAAIKYFTHSGIPNFSEATAAIVLVLWIALDAHANSEAKIPSPANRTRIPGPGANKKTVPTMVIKPPTTPMKIRHTNDPYGVLLICLRMFTPPV